MKPSAPPLPSNPKPFAVGQPLDSNALLDRLIRGQNAQTEYLKWSYQRLTWVVVLLAIPYIVTAVTFLGWLLVCGGVAAILSTAGAEAMDDAVKEADAARRRTPVVEPAPRKPADPPLRLPVDEDGYAAPELPENAEEILRDFGRKSR